MKTNKETLASLNIAILEPSVIIRTGLSSILRKISNLQISITEVTEVEMLDESLKEHQIDILIANPQCLYNHSFYNLREESNNTDLKFMALVSSLFPEEWLRMFDEHIYLYDSLEAIRHKLERIADIDDETGEGSSEEQQSLSAREKEIVICVVKGMTNREIADRLYLSLHTVITHRRNIARKLQIHSPSGLTIYVIVNKLVELSDIKQ